jgi:hypothetical protein
MGEAYSSNGKKSMHSAYWWGKPEGNRPLGIPRRREMDNKKLNLGKTVRNGMDGIDLAQDRDRWRALVNTVTNFPFSYNAGDFLSSCTTGGLSRRAQLS